MDDERGRHVIVLESCVKTRVETSYRRADPRKRDMNFQSANPFRRVLSQSPTLAELRKKRVGVKLTMS
jgi:hypothetical protein